MRQLTLTGLALTLVGAVGLLTIETIAPAHAGRIAGTDYLLAVSGGETGQFTLSRLEDSSAATMATTAHSAMALVCASVFEFGSMRLGYQCRRPIGGGKQQVRI